MPISAVYGLPGKGKSLFMTYYALYLCEKFRKPLVTNFWLEPSALAYYCRALNYPWLCHNLTNGIINFINSAESLTDILYVPGSIVLLDEAGIFLSSREYKDTPKKLLAGLAQSRKNSQYLIYASQSPNQVDSAVRNLVEEIFYCNGTSVWSPSLRNQKLIFKNTRLFTVEKFEQWFRDPKLRKNPIKTGLLATKTWSGAVSAADNLMFAVYDSFTELDKQGSTPVVSTGTKHISPKHHAIFYVPFQYFVTTTEEEAKLANSVIADAQQKENEEEVSGQYLADLFKARATVAAKQNKQNKSSYSKQEIIGEERILTIYRIYGTNNIQPHKYSHHLKRLFNILPSPLTFKLIELDLFLESFTTLNRLETTILTFLPLLAVAMIITTII